VKKKKPALTNKLEKKLGYDFKDKSILERALTHRSWAHEQVASGNEDTVRHLHNEALEFVGDSVLGCVVAEYLFHAYTNITEGELSRMKHRLVSANTLAQAAERLKFGDFMRVGRGEEKTGGRRKQALLADVFEAVIAAIFFDGGFEAAQKFVTRVLKKELKQTTPQKAAAADYKTLLQERLQAEKKNAPCYVVVKTVGPPHRRTFFVEVRWQGGKAHAEGTTIKAAEMSAAQKALEQLPKVTSKLDR
jgi:ribonuclease-3